VARVGTVLSSVQVNLNGLPAAMLLDATGYVKLTVAEAKLKVANKVDRVINNMVALSREVFWKKKVELKIAVD